MLPMLRLLQVAAVLFAALPLAACSAAGEGAASDSRREEVVGLFTSLPIVWRESHRIADLLASDAPPHWGMAVIEAQGAVRPLDGLADEAGRLPLPADGLLVMAQPRPLSPGENVALDDWVRAGGRLLLFADPMLTVHSSYGLGDRRRPQDIVLLSPILNRWGLILQFDEDQPAGERQAGLYGAAVPVDLPGRFAVDGSADCTIEAQGLAVHCRIGSGRVLAIADAALLDEGGSGDRQARRDALVRLLAIARDGIVP